MAKQLVKIRGLADLRRKLKSKFKIILNKSLRDKSLQRAVGQLIVQDIRDNMNFPVKSPYTKFVREILEQYNKTHPDYVNNKINITFTGELLDDLIKGMKVDTTKLAFVLQHTKGKHKPYNSGGKLENSGLKNRKVQVSSIKTKKTRNVTVRVAYTTIHERLVKLNPDYDYLKFKVTMPTKQKIIDEVQKTLMKKIKQEFGQ